MTPDQLTMTPEKLELNKDIWLFGTGLYRWKNVRVFKRPGPARWPNAHIRIPLIKKNSPSVGGTLRLGRKRCVRAQRPDSIIPGSANGSRFEPMCPLRRHVGRPMFATLPCVSLSPILGVPARIYSGSRSCSSKSLTSFRRRSAVTGSVNKAPPAWPVPTAALILCGRPFHSWRTFPL